MNRLFTVGLWILFAAASGFCASGQTYEDDNLFSQTTSELLVRQAIEIFNEAPMDPDHIERAMAFLLAARSLDEQSDWIPEQVLRVGSGNCYGENEHAQQMTWALGRYLQNRPDMELATRAVGCMLEQFNTRSERETLLEDLLNKYTAQKPFFASEIATQLALLKIEKGDASSCVSQLFNAYTLNPYNPMASSKLIELSTEENRIFPLSSQLIDARMRLDINPYDLESAIYYARLLKQTQLYAPAANAYEYAGAVFEYYYPGRTLDSGLLFEWLSSCYLAERMESKCLEVTNRYRDASHFDLQLEAFAGKAMISMGQIGEGKRVLEAAGKQGQSLLSMEDLSNPVHPEDLAWFYSFVLEQPDKGLAWSNLAFEEAPNRQEVQSIFAYNLAQNEQYELALEYVEPLEDNDAVALLTRAVVELARDGKDKALNHLRRVIEIAPDPFMAEKAVGLLKAEGSEYISLVPTETLHTELNNQFPNSAVPEYIEPDKRVSAKLLFGGSEFFYDSDFDSRFVIGNSGKEPLVIDDTGFFTGALHVSAVIEGDLNVELPDLLTTRFRPERPLNAGQQLSVPLDLKTGKLRKLLLTYPQAEVEIRFTVYLDPVALPDGTLENRIRGTEPIVAHIRRKKTTLSREFLLQRLDVLSKGQQGQKLQAAAMFVGLLAEQKAIASGQASYRYVHVEPSLIVDAVRKSLVDPDWKVRAKTLTSLISVSASLDSSIMSEVADNLNHEKWPVRMLAMYLVAQAQPEPFQKVLDWTAEHDANEINRRMAVALGGWPAAPAEE